MPVIDTPPPQLLRGATDSDDRLETGMRETEIVTAVEIDHEAKAQYEEQRRHAASRAEGRAETATGIGEPRVADDTDAIETAGRERVDTDAIAEEVAVPPAAAPAERPSQPAAAAPALRPPQPASPAQRPSQPASPAPQRTSQPIIPNIAPIAPVGPAASATNATSATAAAPAASAPSSAAPNVPISTAPASLPPPKTATLPTSGPTPACPQCESPMAWVEEHLRFYCKSCRMYF